MPQPSSLLDCVGALPTLHSPPTSPPRPPSAPSPTRYLGLQWNSLSGELPSSIGNLRVLSALDISGNRLLGGYVPAAVWRLTSLRELWLNECIFVGTLPEDIGALTALTYLQLYGGNSFSGTLPPSLGNLTQLDTLGLQVRAPRERPRPTCPCPPSLPPC